MISSQADKIKKAMLEGKNIGEPLDIPLEVRRKNWEESARADVLPEGILFSKTVINGIPAEWISTGNSGKDNVILYFHGGGYNSGSIITHRKLVSYITKVADVQTLTIDYPLAPENPYPAALNSSERVYTYLLKHGFQAENIVFGGDSSGGGLAIALTLLLKDKEMPLPKGVFAFSPWLDLTFSGETIKTCADKDPLCSEEDLRADANYYIGTQSPDNPLISPIYGDMTGFPPLLIQVGSDEILLSDSTRFADMAKEKQVNVQLSVWEGMWHVFQAWAGEIPEATEAIAETSRFLKNIFPSLPIR